MEASSWMESSFDGAAVVEEKSERVNVFVRVKPDCRGDGQRRDYLSLFQDAHGHGIRVRREGRHGVQQKQFVFDQVLDETASQSDVYTAVAEPIVDDVLQERILAYGQTGAGKTHTLSSIKPECIGVIPRVAQDVFQKVQNEDTCTVRLSYLQIYCEQIQDLLKPEAGDNLSIREGKKGYVSVPDLSEMEVTCLDDCLRLLQLGDRNRSVAFTELNAHSSRSHAVVIFTVIRYDEMEKRNRVGKLFLVDLAGSERLKKSKSVAQRAVEARAINLSLTTLGKCVSARAMGSPHVPFRDSKLTRLLQESLGGNAKTSMIIAISGDAEHSDETYQSLEFGSRAMHVTTHAEVNVTETDVPSLLDVAGDCSMHVATAREAFMQSSLDATAFMHLKKEQERSKEVIECLEREKLLALQENKKLQDEHEEELRLERREKEAFQNRALEAENKAFEAESAATKKIDELRIQLDRALGQLDEMEKNHEREQEMWEERRATLECVADSYKSSQESLQTKLDDMRERLDQKVEENTSQRDRILELEGQLNKEKSTNLQTSQRLAEVQNDLQSKIAECDALRDVCSAKDDEYGDSIKALEESIESKYKKDIALCMEQIATFKSVIEMEKKELLKTRQSLKETQEHTKVLEQENESLRDSIDMAKRDASRFKRQAKEAIFKFDILNKHFRKVEAENKAARTIQRAYRQYRNAQLQKQRHSDFQELARTKHELGSLAAKHAEMAAKRNSNLAFTGQTLLGEGLEVLQEAVEGLLTTFLLPSKDLKALQRYNSKMKTSKLSGRDPAGLISSATYRTDTTVSGPYKGPKNRHLHYYNLNNNATSFTDP
eukprot:jgi/Picre1/31558/NNA_006910.t1